MLLITQCTKIANHNHDQVHVNPQLASPYTMPASAYLALAKNQADSEKQPLLIMAAGRLIYDGQWRQGLNILAQTSQLTEELTSEKNLLLAKVDLIREQPKSAISKLASVRNVNSLPIYYQAQFHEMLAFAYQSTGNSLEAISERIKLDTLLPDDISKANNRRALWLSLTTLPKPELDALVIEAKERSVLRGWMQLALISRASNESAETTLMNIEQWQREHPKHPANTILPHPLASVKALLYAKPKHIAVLLPLTGALSGPGIAVKDGFMSAYDASGDVGTTTIRFYDTSAGVDGLYQKAIEEGAQFVIGPLSKPDVAKVASMTHPVPTLLLNDLDSSTNHYAYQFGLSPSNEARQVAVKARKAGLTRALVIAPTGTWGDEIVSAFAEQWRTNGGRVVDTLHYGTNDDLNHSIRDFLQVSASEERGKQLKQLLGQKLELSPIRRQDFDVIFLLAYPSVARQIVPLLKYYYAGNIPIYATSSVYAGSANTMKDRDLNGVIFCDMPWVFTHQAGNRNWPEQFNSYNRLYALGMDSFALTTQLNRLLLFPAMGVRDNSGVLYLTPNQQIARISVFGQFRQGLATVINDNH